MKGTYETRAGQIINKALGKLNLALCRQTSLHDLLTSHENSQRYEIFKRLNKICHSDSQKLLLLDLIDESRAQLYQDIAALILLDFKKGGYFVEFGSTNGKDLSNTYLLEKSYKWSGILSEPAKIWHKDLESNRNCIIDFRAISNKTGMNVTMRETDNPEFSSTSLNEQSNSPFLATKAKPIKYYDVTSISLEDLLDEHQAPRAIDYISVDTEGSEYEILKSFNFDKYRFRVITCEHNFSENEEKLISLMEDNGYINIMRKQTGWDAWFIHESLEKQFSMDEICINW